MNQSKRSNLNNIGDMTVYGSLTIAGPGEGNDGKLTAKGDVQIINDSGDYTIVAKEDYLCLKNNKTGKLYKFVLEEVSEGVN